VQKVLAVTLLAGLFSSSLAVICLLFFHAISRIGYVVMPEVAIRAVDSALRLSPGSVVVDLGAGDGRVLAALGAAHRISLVAYETNPVLVAYGKLFHRSITWHRQDLFEADFAPATHVVVYLSPELNLRLSAVVIDQLQPGTRLVSVQFPVPDVKGSEIAIEGAPAHANRLYIYDF
jgi:SAM-dependent methyltransferase